MELKAYDVLLLKVVNTDRDIFDLICQDRLISETPIELDFNNCLKLTKSFFRSQSVISNAREWGFPDQAIELMMKINEGTDLSIYDYESMLLAIRYAGFSLIIVGRTDIQIIDNNLDVGEFDVLSYLLDNLHENTPGLTNFYIGTSKMYKNDGEGLYPFAIDFASELGLSPEEMDYYNIQASQDNYINLANINELRTFNDEYTRSVIKGKGLKFIRIRS